MAGARHRRYDPLVLPQRAGNEELISRCFEILNEAPPWDFASSVVELIRSNATDDERMERWRRAMQASVGADRVRWMRYGLALKTLPSIYQDELRQWITDCALEPELIRVIIASGHSRYLESDESRCETAVDVVLDASCSLSAFSRPHSMLELLAQSLDARRYAGAFESHGPIPLLAQWRHRQAEGETWDKIVDESANSFSELPISAKAKRVILLSADLASRTTAEWAREIEPWSILVESARAEFGERRSLLFLAVVGAAIRSKTVRCDSFSELFDHSKPLCYRVRYARLRAGSASWWRTDFTKCNATATRRLCYLL